MKKESLLHDKGTSFVVPFILITLCFALWGFANDITNPMVKAFSKIFRMKRNRGGSGAGCVLRRVFRDGVSRGNVYPQIFV